MAFKFYLDGQLTDQPNNDTELITTIKRDSQLKALTITQDAELIWTNNNNLATGEISGYDYLFNLFEDGICNEASLVIYDEISSLVTRLAYTGVIKVPNMQFDEQNFSVKTKVQDNSFYAYLYNNKDIKVNLTADRTKNKEPLTPIAPYAVDLYVSSTGVYGSSFGVLYKGYKIYDVFDFIVRALSDNNVTFQSTYLSSLTYTPMIFRGLSLLNPYTLFPTAELPVFELSFQDVFTEVDKLLNISFYIDMSDPDNPVLRIEDTESLYTEEGNFTFSDIKELKTSVDSSKLYGQVTVGSSITVDGQDPAIYTFNEATSYYGWKREQFFPLGQCNTNAELNLVNNWILSNNVIMDVAVAQSTSYNDDYIIVECDNVDDIAYTAIATQFDYFGQTQPPYFYNIELNNYNKMQRHSDKFETIFGSFLGIGGSGFRALQGDDPTQDITYMTGNVNNPNFIPPTGLIVDSEYVNETTQGGYDGTNNYSNVTFEYVVPADGDYSFHHFFNAELEGLLGIDSFNIIPYIIQYDSALVQKSQSSGAGGSYFTNAIIEIDAVLVCPCVAGDRIKAGYSISYSPNQSGQYNIARTLTVLWNTFFECTDGVAIAAGNRDIKKLLHQFDYDIDETDWEIIKSNPTAQYPFEKDGVTRYGWLEEIKRNDWTGRTSVKLISGNATS